MKKRKPNPEDAARLRQKAEKILKASKDAQPCVSSEADRLKLIHELEVHQIELKLQNEELVAAKEKAEQAEEKYTVLYDFAPSGYLSLIKEAYITNLNFAAARMLGKERSKLINSRFAIFLSKDTRSVFNQFLEKAFTTKEKQSCEAIIETKDKSEPEPIYVTIDGIVNQNGKLCHLTLVDISNRMKTERKLKESEEKYSTIINEINDGIYITDSMGVISFCNMALAKILGFAKPEEVIGHKFTAFLPPDKADEFYAKYKKAIEEGNSSKAFEAEIVKPDGQAVYLEITSTAIIANDKVIGMRGVILDISDRKEAEEKLRDTNERFTRLVSLLNDIVWSASYDGSEITELTDSFERIYGVSLDELKANPKLWIEVVHPDDRHIAEASGKELLEKGKTQAEYRIVKPDGTLVWLLDNKALIYDKSGKPFQMGGIAKDITVRKQAEAEIFQKNKELQKLNSEKDKFFSIIAHDLKSPFNSILGFSDLLVEQVQENDYDGMEKYAKVIHDSSQRAVDLLMNLMEWSRSQTGRMEFTPEYLKIAELCKETIGLLRTIAVQKSITIKNEVSPKAIAFADKAMISTVLRNLISNVIKFTKSGGKIMVSAHEKPNELIISVSDSGIGIPEDRLEKLFILSESHSTMGTNKEKGTGLGLILCKEFVEKNGGRIWVESKEGQGSSFSYTLPKS